MKNHSRSMLSEGTNGELHDVQEDVVVFAAVLLVLVLIEDAISDVVDETGEKVEIEIVVELIVVASAVVVVVVVAGPVVVVVRVVLVVEVDGALVVLLVALCVRLLRTRRQRIRRMEGTQPGKPIFELDL